MVEEGFNVVEYENDHDGIDERHGKEDKSHRDCKATGYGPPVYTHTLLKKYDKIRDAHEKIRNDENYVYESDGESSGSSCLSETDSEPEYPNEYTHFQSMIVRAIIPEKCSPLVALNQRKQNPIVNSKKYFKSVFGIEKRNAEYPKCYTPGDSGGKTPAFSLFQYQS